MAAKPRNVLAPRKCTVTLLRNGLSLEVPDVPAADAAIVAKAMLDAVRGLVDAGYEELIVDAGGVHASALGEFPEDEGIEEAHDPPVMRRRRTVGFTTS